MDTVTGQMQLHMNKIMGGGKMTGFEPKKSLGQHWLNDSKILSKIVSYANLSKQDYVLEVGPGLGSLTSMISSQAGKVLAVEIDDTLFKHLKLLNLDQNLEIINQDILKFDLYSATKRLQNCCQHTLLSNFTFNSFTDESTNPPIKIVLLIQKEVAERIAAKPGSMSILSVVVQQYFNV